MPARPLNSTEKKLIQLIKEIRKQHKPRAAFWGSFIRMLRNRLVVRKNYSAHSLSLYCTEDFLLGIQETFGYSDINFPFARVMHEVDKEILSHWGNKDEKDRAPHISHALQGVRELMLKNPLPEDLWNPTEFGDLLASYVRENSLNHETVTQEAIRIITGESGIEESGNRYYHVFSLNWVLLRAMATGWLVRARKKNTSIGAGVIPNDQDLEDQSRLEIRAMSALYGSVILAPYLEDYISAAEEEFGAGSPTVNRVISACSRLLSTVGYCGTAFYLGSMAASIIDMGTSNTHLVNDTIVNITDGGTSATITTTHPDNATTTTTTPLNLVRNTTGDGSFQLVNLPGIPGTVSTLLIMYVSLPIVMFTSYKLQAMVNSVRCAREEERARNRVITPISASLGIKLVLNTMVCFNPHIKSHVFSQITSLCIFRIYTPLSVIGQSSRTRNAYEVAQAALMARRREFRFSNRNWIAACIACFAPEYLTYALNSGAMWSVVGNGSVALQSVGRLLTFMFKFSARVGALFLPLYFARRSLRAEDDDLPYSRRFEILFWSDAIRALTAAPILMLFDATSGSPLLFTIVTTGDTLVSMAPDLIAGPHFGILSSTALRLAALETFREKKLTETALLQLVGEISGSSSVGCTMASIRSTMEDSFGETEEVDHGMDGIIDKKVDKKDKDEEEEAQKSLESRALVVSSGGPQSGGYVECLYQDPEQQFTTEESAIVAVESPLGGFVIASLAEQLASVEAAVRAGILVPADEGSHPLDMREDVVRSTSAAQIQPISTPAHDGGPAARQLVQQPQPAASSPAVSGTQHGTDAVRRKTQTSKASSPGKSRIKRIMENNAKAMEERKQQQQRQQASGTSAGSGSGPVMVSPSGEFIPVQQAPQIPALVPRGGPRPRHGTPPDDFQLESVVIIQQSQGCAVNPNVPR